MGEALIEWCECEVRAADALPRSGLGEAVGYVLNQVEALSRYLDGGRLAIDNNACERSPRGNAIERKNWLFTDFRGRRLPGAAAMFSLISSAKRNH
ncbi:MAG: transposase, partial [Phycisphaeraceae bacterium]|nr:transposase [Phycisphaeraceae bacterium]